MIRQFNSLWTSKQRPAVAHAAATLGIAVVAGGILLGWSNLRMRDASMALDAERQALSDAALVTEELGVMRTELPQREQRGRELLAGGFLAGTDRVHWAEAVAASARTLQPLNYSAAIGTSQWQPLPDVEAAWYAAHGLEAPSLHTTDMILRVQGLHEVELQHLLDVARQAGGGVTRIEQCDISRRSDDVGLDAECTLRRFGLGIEAADSAVEAGMNEENPS